jgi:hypothetical protein
MMAYDRKKIYDKAQKLIVNKELIFMTEVISLLPISNATFYLYYPDNSEELDTLKALIEENKTNLKMKLRQKMFKEGKSADNIVLYKLAGTKEERDILNGVDTSSQEVKPAQTININYVKPENK